MEAHEARRGLGLEGQFLDLTVTSPAELTAGRPLQAVQTHLVRTLEDGTISGIGTRHVLQLVEHIDTAEVDGQVEGHSITTPCRMPDAGLVEVHEMVGTLSTLVLARCLRPCAPYGMLQGVGQRGGCQRSPLAGPLLVDGTQLHLVARFRPESIDSIGELLDGAVGLSVIGNLIVVSILHGLPARCEPVSPIGCEGSLGCL